ncbi:MAG: CDP-diacylglycerol--serine O-phosphatidyltransferase [Ignavibacteria bacterium CG2_30_36_16]|nr:MAG: CDP-diacylglycerol--serine O-phosphatidyltransferase [Ignavibacteria bacterium CG2_30_36_16]
MKMNIPRIPRSVVPNLFTAMNMFAGFLSIINASQGKFKYAAWLIFIAAIFDALDGFMARLTKSSSELGVQLDSLSDVVSFGVAPAFLIYQTYFYQFNSWGIILSSLLMIAGGFRLARFNVQLVGFDKAYFKGLPIPSSAITIAGFILAYYKPDIGFSEPYNYFIIPMVLLLSFVMVSKIKYDTLPKLTRQGLREKPGLVIFIVISAIALIVTKGNALFYVFVFMVLFGIFRHIFNKINKNF